MTLNLSPFETELSSDYWITLEEFDLLDQRHFKLNTHLESRLHETRSFIDYLLRQQIQVYGLTTGFADLRNTAVTGDKAALLSENMIRSHDAGIGEPMPLDVTFKAMCLRAHSLSKGYSGFSIESFNTLIQMINARIIPEIPCTGSLGASGDLAFLARLGRAMMGDPVAVHFRGTRMMAGAALKLANIPKMEPKAKEGLALTNGTSFMASMLGIGYHREIKFLENVVALMGLFLNAVGAIDAAFCESMQAIRYQKGQILTAKLFIPFFDRVKSHEVQNDYSIRCLPQILGPKIEIVLEQREKIENELNAITDNPLIFRGSEISADVDPARIIPYNGLDWAVISGGNFHGENAATIGDTIALANAKIALTLERQLTYALNPFRNQRRFPIYLVADPAHAGFHSGFMITQYTGNALAHKISLLAQPTSHMNITSANESEDVVSYGATSTQKMLSQIDLLNQLLAIHLVTTAQAYSIKRARFGATNELCETLFEKIQSHIDFPRLLDESFENHYATALSILDSGSLGKVIGNPLSAKHSL